MLSQQNLKFLAPVESEGALLVKALPEVYHPQYGWDLFFLRSAFSRTRQKGPWETLAQEREPLKTASNQPVSKPWRLKQLNFLKSQTKSKQAMLGWTSWWSQTLLKTCNPECLLQRPETSKLPKVVRRGRTWCLGVCGPTPCCTGAREAALVPLAAMQERLALVQNRAALVKESVGRLSLQLVKTPFAPSPNQFGQFWVFGPL